MDEKGKNRKTAAIVGIAVLAAVSLLIAVFVNSVERNRRETITLPDVPSAEEPAQNTKPEEPEDVFAQITAENVQTILSGLSRPAFYHQSMTLTTYAGSASREQQAEIWSGGEQVLIQLTDEFETKTFLTDGQTLYVWYADSDTVSKVDLTGSIGRDDLTGVPAYEALLNISRTQLDDAEFLALSEEDDLQCVFVQCTQDGIQSRYWISLDTGLLYRYMALSGSEPYYAVQQTQLETLMEGDEALSGIFVLPDGTHPFSDTEDAAEDTAGG